MTDDGRPNEGPRPGAPRSVRDVVRHLVPEAHTPPRTTAAARTFTMDGEEWLARIAGHSAVGTGTRGHAFLTAIHFFRADRPDEPLREALLPRGRFEALFEEELRGLLREARPILPPGSREASEDETASDAATRPQEEDRP